MKKSLSLQSENIQSLCDEIQATLAKEKNLSAHRISGVVLMSEELLLLYQEKFGQDAVCNAEVKKEKGSFSLIFHLPGEAVDPDRIETAYTYRHLMKYAQDIPVWSYENGQNVITWQIPYSNSLSKILAFSWQYTVGERARFWIAFAVQIIGTVFNITISFLCARLIVHYTDNAVQEAAWAALTIFACTMLEELTICISDRLYARVSHHIMREIHRSLVNDILSIRTASINDHGNSVFIRRATDDTETMAGGLVNFTDMVIQIAGYIGTLVAVFCTSKECFLYEMILLLILYIVQTWRSKAMMIYQYRSKEDYEKYASFLTETIRGHNDIRALHFENEISEKLNRRLDTYSESSMEHKRKRWKYRLISSTVMNVGDLLFMLLIVLLLSKGLVAPAVAIVLYNYHSRLGNKAVFTVMHFSDLSTNIKLAGRRIHSLISSREFPKEQFGKVHLDQVKGQIEFDNVSFAYHRHGEVLREGNLVLKNLSFRIEPKQFVAFVGNSGCGKSTILRLLDKLYSPTGGEIRLDGTNLDVLDKDSIRGNIAFISQSPYLFNASIRDNLAFVKPDMTEDEMIRVCKAACIHDDILNMEDGYDTIISESGIDLSGGQRQRLAIARGLLMEVPIFLMDEATSALDNTTQNQVLVAIEELARNHTVLMIAHRLSTIVHADKIFYIKDGKVSANGNHETLMKECEAYRELYSAEQGAL